MTKSEFKEILDKVFNNGQPVKTYSGDGLDGVRLYMNDMSVKGKIITRDFSENTYIIAILNPDEEAYYEDTEIKYKKFKAMKDANILSSSLRSYNRGVSSYIPMKQYIRNCLAFLSLTTTDDFDKLNPQIYKDLVNIVKKYCGLNNKGLTYFGKYAEASNTSSYGSYIPEMLLFDMCIYFEDLGVYSGTFIPVQAPFLYSTPLNKLPNIQSMLSSFLSLDDFKRLLEEKAIRNDAQKEAFDLFFAQYGNDINVDNLLTFSLFTNGTYLHEINLYEIPKTCIYNFNPSYSISNRVTNTLENFVITRYYYFYNSNTHEIMSHNVTVTQNAIDTTVNLNHNNTVYTNGKYRYIKSYANVASTQNWIHYQELSTGQAIAIKKIPLQCYAILSTSYPETYLYNFLLNNINIDTNDLVYIFSNSTNYVYAELKIVVCRDVNTLEINGSVARGIINSTRGGKVYGIRENGQYATTSDSTSTISYSWTTLLKFDGNKTIDVYTVTKDRSTYTDWTLTDTQSYIYETANLQTLLGLSSAVPSKYVISNNLGEMLDYNLSEFNGITKTEGDTYPSGIVSLSDFENFYSNAKLRTINNPYYFDGELQANLLTDNWIGCTVGKTIPASSSNAQDNDVDDIPDDDWNDIEKDIDASTEDEDDDDENSDKAPDEALENTGTSPDFPNQAELPNALVMGLIKQYVLDTANLVLLGQTMTSTGFWDSANNLLANPLEAIVSLQAGYIYSPRSAQVEVVKINGVEYNNPTVSGRKLFENMSDIINLGTLPVNFVNENYLDIEDTYMQLYLPWVGLVDIDISKFIGRYIRLTCRVDSLTGAITYHVHALENETDDTNKGQMIAQFSGLSYFNIPLKSDNFMRFFESLGGGR